jgi:hypothetical protein
LAELVHTANRHLAYAQNQAERLAVAHLLEDVLHSADAYRGYGYLPSEWVQLLPLGEVRLRTEAEGFDDTRREYYAPSGPAAPHDLRWAVRLVVIDQRLSHPDLYVSPADAVDHVLNTMTTADPAPLGATTVHDDGTDTAKAYRLVLQSTPGLREMAVEAVYGQHADSKRTIA